MNAFQYVAVDGVSIQCVDVHFHFERETRFVPSALREEELSCLAGEDSHVLVYRAAVFHRLEI